MNFNGEIQADDTFGELLQLELKTLQNEECYNRFLNVSETDRFGRKGSTGKKNKIPNPTKRSLYDGITDQVLCTVFTCDGKTPSLDARAKCVSDFDLKADIWKYSTLIRFLNMPLLYFTLLYFTLLYFTLLYFFFTFFCNRGDTIQYHGGLRSRELGQAPMLLVFLTPKQALSSHPRVFIMIFVGVHPD